MKLFPHLDIILASQSPRRAQLLLQAGIPFRVQAVPVEEDYPPELASREVASFLARKKAKAAAILLTKPNELLLCADSVVILNDKIYGKPVDREDALNIIRALSGQKHTVVTGVCLKSKEKEVVFNGVSDVYFSSLTEEEIAYYVDISQPYDKAGAYGIQEWIGLCKIYRIEGTYHNIMGLPVDLVYKALLNW